MVWRLLFLVSQFGGGFPLTYSCTSFGTIANVQTLLYRCDCIVMIVVGEPVSNLATILIAVSSSMAILFTQMFGTQLVALICQCLSIGILFHIWRMYLLRFNGKEMIDL